LTRNLITDRFLAEFTRCALAPDELPAHAGRSFDLVAASYGGRCLPRPVFLAHHERTGLERQLNHLLTALEALPDRLFGGDRAAYARSLGLAGRQVAAVQRNPAARLTRLGRADLYHDGAGFRLMELNLGSTVGGLDNALLNRALLAHPMVAAFTSQHGLSYIDTLVELVDTLRAECEVPPGQRPLVAAVDLPEAFAQLEPQLRLGAAALEPLGLDVIPGHLGQLTMKDGRVYIAGRPVDVIYRIFLLSDLTRPGGAELIEPVLRAVERGEVAMFTPIDTALYSSKAALAMLSDEANRHLLSADELASLDSLLPWTRMVRDEAVTVDGEPADLREYALDRRDELVLKPASMYGGTGVVLGWRVDDNEWRSELDQAMGKAYVLQRRIRGVPEAFPGPDGPEPWLLRWGVFSVHRGYGGASVAGSRDLAGGVLNLGVGTSRTGATVGGCCFHELPPADRTGGRGSHRH
jgi:hypothetical protein